MERNADKTNNKKSQQRVWHVNNRGEMNDAADGTRSEMRIWDRKWHDMKHTMNVEWKFTRLVNPVVFKIDYNDVPFLSGSFWKKQAEGNWKIPSWLFATKKKKREQVDVGRWYREWKLTVRNR